MMYFLNTKHMKLSVEEEGVDWMETPSGKMSKEIAFLLHPELFTFSTGGRKLGILTEMESRTPHHMLLTSRKNRTFKV